MKIQTFKDLEAWKDGYRLVLMVYAATKTFPKEEMFGLTSQLRRAAVSVTTNIAKGFSRQSYKEKEQFYAMAAGSITEIQSQLEIANDVKHIKQEKYVEIYDQSVKTHKILNGLISSTRRYIPNFKSYILPLLFLLYSIFYILYSTPLYSTSASAATISKSPASSLTNGLVGYWTFDGRDTNWATGQTFDQSGKGNTGTLTSMSTSTSPVAGKIGQALKFDGVDDNVKSGQVLPTATSSPFTLSAWARASGPGSNGWGTIVGTQTSWAETTYNSGIFRFGQNGGGGWWINGPAVTINRWYHVVGVYSGTHASLYVDSALVAGPTQNSFTSNHGNSLIGSYINTGGEFFNGLIDDVRIYNRALTASEIQRLYQLGQAKFAVSPKQSLTSGLVGYWTFDGRDTNWATGKTQDRSGQGLTGTMTNMATSSVPTPGKIGGAFSFDGNNDFVNIGDNTALQFASTSAFTISAWVKAINQSANLNVIFGKYNGSGTGGYRFYFETTSQNSVLGFQVADLSSQSFVNANFRNKSNVWTHVAATFNQSVVTFYVNGALDSSGTLTRGLATSTTAAHIGDSTNSTFTRFLGTIDDVRIYNRALTASEIQRLYQLGQAKFAVSPKQSLTSGLVGYWTFDGRDTNWATGQTFDQSGKGNTGTLTSMSTSTSPVAGKIGQALKFDGVDDFVKLSNFPAQSVFTFSAWIYPKSFGAGNGPDLISGQCVPQNGYFVQLRSTGNLEGGYQCLVSGGATVTSGIVINKWQFVVVTISGTNVTVYVDGILKGTNGMGASATNASQQMDIGGRQDDYFNGLIDDVRIYNRALSAQEVRQLYNMGK